MIAIIEESSAISDVAFVRQNTSQIGIVKFWLAQSERISVACKCIPVILDDFYTVFAKGMSFIC